MLLNADCVLDVASATRLFQRCETERSIVAPIQVDLTTGATVCAGAVPLTLLGFPTLRERTETGGFWDRFTIVCGGRGVAIPTAVFEKIGMLAAESLPHYWADHDFFMRCRRAGFAMEIQADLQVAVDGTRTTSAARPSNHDWGSFQTSLSEPGSHRNRTAIRAFFRRNYPIRPLHFIGSMLYLVRYTAVWALRRAAQLLRRSHVL
jgi:GT2 family glycosyltransferase